MSIVVIFFYFLAKKSNAMNVISVFASRQQSLEHEHVKTLVL